jgi:hypothetical protein
MPNIGMHFIGCNWPMAIIVILMLIVNNIDKYNHVLAIYLSSSIAHIIYRTCCQQSFDWCCRWLYAPRLDGRPRMLNIYLTNKHGEALNFINLIKKVG